MNKEPNQIFIFESSSFKNIYTDHTQRCVEDLGETLSI